MSTNNKEWSRVVADSLRDAEIDVPDQVWSRIEKDLPSVSLNNTSRIIRLVSAVAAVVVFGIASWMAYQPNVNTPATSDLYIAEDIVTELDIIYEQPLYEGVDPCNLNDKKSLIPTGDVEQLKSTQDVHDDNMKEDDDQMATTEVVTTAEKSTPREEPSNITNLKSNQEITFRNRSKTRQSTVLAINLTGAGASLSTSSLGYIAQPTLHVGDIHSYSETTESRFLDSYYNSDISHRQPLGVSLSAGYFISNKFMLVGGVGYSVLVSDLSMTNGDNMVQRLQFIGIPVRIDYAPINHQRFMLYGGIGAGVEYLLSAKVDDIKIDEKRWHYSISSAIGAEYKFNNWLGLYAEPELSYYLNNTKLETIRTNSPIAFTLKFGLRFTL